ncbi:MAG TPA: D-Ala-D-Ala carboxypeptidase family metallohydrolase [Burkholderiaceae bacterium]|nr:D-Ala-D-Ala carboxypeptidase family metallohydrolase [Burkholderiaceae bacterium]
MLGGGWAVTLTDGKLSAHFDLEEFLVSEIAARRGIDNTPTPEIVENLKRLALALEDVRMLLGHPIYITSGYRCPALNVAVGGSATSAHPYGLAADFICPGFGAPLDICTAIAAAGIVFDQLIHEFGRWVHFGLAIGAAEPRRQVLTARFADGSTLYEPGLLKVAA